MVQAIGHHCLIEHYRFVSWCDSAWAIKAATAASFTMSPMPRCSLVRSKPQTGSDDLRVEDAEFDQLTAQSYIEHDKKMPGLVFRISEDGRKAAAS
jgi:hypothetical protein